MKRDLRMLAATGVLLGGLLAAEAALAQKAGGVLSIYHRDGPASMSILEEATISTVAPMMGFEVNVGAA